MERGKWLTRIALAVAVLALIISGGAIATLYNDGKFNTITFPNDRQNDNTDDWLASIFLPGGSFPTPLGKSEAPNIGIRVREPGGVFDGFEIYTFGGGTAPMNGWDLEWFAPNIPTNKVRPIGFPQGGGIQLCNQTDTSTPCTITLDGNTTWKPGTSIQGPFEDAITATGTTQGGAYPLTSVGNRVTVVTPTNDGVLLPTQSLAQQTVWIMNDDASDTLKIYPTVAINFITLGINLPISVVAGDAAEIYECGTEWCADVYTVQ